MINRQRIKTPMPTRPPEERNKDFAEVTSGYGEDEAVNEAGRCLNCKDKPCVSGCPVSINIPAFIAEIRNRNFEGAYEIIAKESSLAAICGRVCPQETQCEAVCVRGKAGEPVAIGRLERFVADRHYENLKKRPRPTNPAPDRGIKIAVVGSGPAGLSCAGTLVKRGYKVTVFEALHTAGGVLVYGIPEFRLPKEIVRAEIRLLADAGVEFRLNCVVGKTLTVAELRKEYRAVFIGNGAGLPGFMHIPGENLNGVFSANEFLTRVNLMKAYEDDSDTPLYDGKKVAVVGGGNVAMDAARCALRLGADVKIIYRRSELEMPARREEVLHAKEEGVELCTLTNPEEILDDGHFRVKGVKCIKMELGEPDESGRRRPIPIPGSEFVMERDTVIMSIGTSANPLIKNTTPELKVKKRGELVVDERGETTLEGVFAGGDAVSGSATVISAMASGKRAAEAIIAEIEL